MPLSPSGLPYRGEWGRQTRRRPAAWSRAGELKKKVLVVDDDQLLLESVASALEASGYAVWATDSVARALTLAREVEPDVVVSDYRMPGMDGISLLARLREISESPRMVVYSATPLEGKAELARLGVTWIAKTARHGSLLGTLEAMLDEGAGE